MSSLLFVDSSTGSNTLFFRELQLINYASLSFSKRNLSSRQTDGLAQANNIRRNIQFRFDFTRRRSTNITGEKTIVEMAIYREISLRKARFPWPARSVSRCKQTHREGRTLEHDNSITIPSEVQATKRY